MESRQFDSTNYQIPVIGQGTWYIDAGDRALAIAALRRGIDLDMNHIDTAEMCGDAEEIVGHGSFPGPDTPGGRVLQEIAAAHNATPRQVALRFLVRRPSLFTIPKASRPDHTTENAGAGDLRLTEAELARIDRAFPLGPRPRTLPVL
jgi:diketogulonate reductase-like aldo/keto reductase